MRDGMPEALRERLGEAAAEGLIQFLDARDAYMTDAIAEAVGQTLEPRFAAIEAQLSQCVTQSAFEAHASQVAARFEQVDQRFEQIDRRFEQIDRRFEQIDRRFEKIDDRFEKTDDRVTAFETRVMTKLDAQFLAIDTKLSRVMTVQIGTITVFASIVGGAFIALLARS